MIGTRTYFVLTVALASLAAMSCGSSSEWQFCPGPGSACRCEGNDCRCEGGSYEWRSEGGDEFRCAAGSSCYASCTGACSITCDADTSCTILTGAGSVVTCRDGARCDVECNGACDLTCSDPATCTLECRSGSSGVDGSGCS